jgi:hypothetical protein
MPRCSSTQDIAVLEESMPLPSFRVHVYSLIVSIHSPNKLDQVELERRFACQDQHLDDDGSDIAGRPKNEA